MVHIGVIPDGNRRWCRQNAVALSDLAMRHVALLLSMFTGFSQLCELHPGTIGSIDEVSVYLLSCDNTLRSDGTLEMVAVVLECALVLARLLALFRSAESVKVVKNMSSMGITSDEAAATDETHTTIEMNDAFLDEVVESSSSLSALSASGGFVSQLLEHYGVEIRTSGRVLDRLRDCYVGDLLRSCCSEQSSSSPSCKHVVRLDWCSSGSLKRTIRIKSSDPDAAVSTVSRMEAIPLTPVHFFGVDDCLPKRVCSVRDEISKLFCGDTSVGKTVRLNVALGYDPVEDARRYLLAGDVVDRTQMDLVLRTSGEMRTSGFFPMQTLYSEWFFVEKLFPDLTADDLDGAIRRFRARNRRFGK